MGDRFRPEWVIGFTGMRRSCAPRWWTWNETVRVRGPARLARRPTSSSARPSPRRPPPEDRLGVMMVDPPDPTPAPDDRRAVRARQPPCGTSARDASRGSPGVCPRPHAVACPTIPAVRGREPQDLPVDLQGRLLGGIGRPHEGDLVRETTTGCGGPAAGRSRGRRPRGRWHRGPSGGGRRRGRRPEGRQTSAAPAGAADVGRRPRHLPAAASEPIPRGYGPPSGRAQLAGKTGRLRWEGGR